MGVQITGCANSWACKEPEPGHVRNWACKELDVQGTGCARNQNLGVQRAGCARNRDLGVHSCPHTHQDPPRRLPLAGHCHPQPHVLDDGLVRLICGGTPGLRGGSPLLGRGFGVVTHLGEGSPTFDLDGQALAVPGGGTEGTGVHGTCPCPIHWLCVLGGSHQQPGGQEGGQRWVLGGRKGSQGWVLGVNSSSQTPQLILGCPGERTLGVHQSSLPPEQFNTKKRGHPHLQGCQGGHGDPKIFLGTD